VASDPDIDRLYQVPLAEFTAERNALAASLGKAGAPIKALPKPSVAAWAVNQLYWRHRPVYDALTRASLGRRAAHGRVISGRTADLGAADAAHQDAVRAALAAVRALLKEAGDPASPATLNAVKDTLEALPGDDAPGRLTRPLMPAGFEALAGLVPSGREALRAVSPRAGAVDRDGLSKDSAAERRAKAREAVVAERRAAEAARREKQARLRDAAAVEKMLRAARAAERLAEAAFGRARQDLGRAERERERLQDQVAFLEKQAQDLVEQLQRHEQALAKAAAERTQLERRLAALKG
jgi:hypothetical protein